MFRVGKRSNTPKNIIITPLTIPKVDEFLVKNEPTEDAIAAKDINTIENPKQNSIDPFNLLCNELSVPENIVRYPGTRGKTQDIEYMAASHGLFPVPLVQLVAPIGRVKLVSRFLRAAEEEAVRPGK